MEDKETARMRKYGESKTTRIMMATVSHVTSGSGLRKFQADEFLFDRVYKRTFNYIWWRLISVLQCLRRRSATKRLNSSLHYRNNKLKVKPRIRNTRLFVMPPNFWTAMYIATDDKCSSHIFVFYCSLSTTHTNVI